MLNKLHEELKLSQKSEQFVTKLIGFMLLTGDTKCMLAFLSSSFQSFWSFDANWFSTPSPNTEVYFTMKISQRNSMKSFHYIFYFVKTIDLTLFSAKNTINRPHCICALQSLISDQMHYIKRTLPLNLYC